MTKFVFTSLSGGPKDYPTLGFSAVTGAILNGATFTPPITLPPDAEWAVYGGGSAETGINRYAQPALVPTRTEPTDGYLLAYSSTANEGVYVDPLTGFTGVVDPVLTAVDANAGSALRTQQDARLAALYAGSGTAENPITNAAAARPTGHPVVYWKCSTSPTNLDPADVWIDTGTVVALPHKVMREDVTVRLGALDWITLGADPVANSIILWKNGTLLATSAYTITGREIAITGAAAADVITVYYLLSGDQTATSATTPARVVDDPFTRADSAVSLGTAGTGQAWTSARGTWGIQTNQAYLVTSGGVVGGASINDVGTVDAGVADCVVQVKLAAGTPGLIVRATDADNGLTTNLTGLFRRTAGVNNAIGTFSAAFVVGDTIRIRLAGTSIKVYRQAGSTGAFVLGLTVTESQGSTVTKHGFRTSAAGAKLDDFVVGA